ncbi:MAG TPA: chromate transporter [Bryobacteraceae bacterium]|nr:chromate transporter [Bryobacteraceae bacterium]
MSVVSQHADSVLMTSKPTLTRLATVFLRIGNTTFGGGDPTMAALQRELVQRRAWLTAEDFALAYALARITPGTNVVAFCVAVGARILGTGGAIAGALGESLPAAMLAVLIAWGYESLRANPFAMAMITGTVAAVAGMMWASVWLLVRPQIRGSRKTIRAALIFGASFVAAWKFGITPIPVIGAAALAGFLWKEE